VHVVNDTRPTSATDDYTLILQIALNDEQALAELYRRYGDKLYGLAMQMMQNHQEAEEALQDTFVQIWKRARQYDKSKATPFSWAVMMMRHHCIDRLRARDRKAVLLFNYEHAHWEAPVDSHHGRHAAQEAELAHKIALALEQLPGEQLEPITMAFYQGLSQAEIAQKTRQPLGTIKSRIRRGMLHLRELLRDIYA
jgi:RNA polymerase sigma-70 factor (ECF subfamily)